MVLEDGSVSSQHVRLQLQNNRLRLVDMGSTNGSRVNYIEVQKPVYLLDGDTVEFGNVSFTVDGPDLQPPEPDQPSLLAPVVDLEPLEASQPLADTMTSLSLPEDMDMAPASAGSASLPQVPAPTNADPERRAFWVAFALILLSGIALLLRLWLHPTTP
jgi:pSer/pThr/pTyr-binding forkhead associated (FHA) protein